MLASLIIVFREVLEAGLIVGIVLAATEGSPRRGRLDRRRHRRRRARRGAAGRSSPARSSDAFAGNGQELFNACDPDRRRRDAGLAPALDGQPRPRDGARDEGDGPRRGARRAGRCSPWRVVVAVAVLREGAEVVLFLYGIAASATEGAAALLLGGALGVLGRRAGLLAAVSRPGRDPGAPAVRGHRLADRPARRRHGRAGRGDPGRGGPDPEPGATSSGTRPGCCPKAASPAARCTRWSAIPTGRWACSSPPGSPSSPCSSSAPA